MKTGLFDSEEFWLTCRFQNVARFIAYGSGIKADDFSKMYQLMVDIFRDLGDGLSYPITKEEFSGRYLQVARAGIVLCTTVLSQWDIFHGKFGLLSTGKASCDRVALPNMLYMLGVSVSIVHRTLTWTTGSLTCAQMLMHAIAHGVYGHT